MGNNISRILKDHFLASEVGMKNKTYFEKGRVRRSTDMVTGGTYMKLYSKKKRKVFKSVGSIANWNGVEKTFFKRVRCIINNLRCTMTQGTP